MAISKSKAGAVKIKSTAAKPTVKISATRKEGAKKGGAKKGAGAGGTGRKAGGGYEWGGTPGAEKAASKMPATLGTLQKLMANRATQNAKRAGFKKAAVKTAKRAAKRAETKAQEGEANRINKVMSKRR